MFYASSVHTCPIIPVCLQHAESDGIPHGDMPLLVEGCQLLQLIKLHVVLLG